MNTQNSHQSLSGHQGRRAFLCRGFAAAATSILLASCDQSMVVAADIENGKKQKSVEKNQSGRPTMPKNTFKKLPKRPELDKTFIARVEKITMEQRRGKMSAFEGGGKASDETEKLQALGLRPFDTLGEIQTAYKNGKLVQLGSIDNGRYFAVGTIGTADLRNQPWYNLIHPDALARFNEHVASIFYAKTGKMLKVTGVVRSEEYQAKLRQTNAQATKKISPHTFGRTIDVSIPEVFNPKTARFESMSSVEREFISKLLTYYELNAPGRTSWLVENGNAYHGTHYPVR